MLGKQREGTQTKKFEDGDFYEFVMLKNSTYAIKGKATIKLVYYSLLHFPRDKID